MFQIHCALGVLNPSLDVTAVDASPVTHRLCAYDIKSAKITPKITVDGGCLSITARDSFDGDRGVFLHHFFSGCSHCISYESWRAVEM